MRFEQTFGLLRPSAEDDRLCISLAFVRPNSSAHSAPKQPQKHSVVPFGVSTVAWPTTRVCTVGLDQIKMPHKQMTVCMVQSNILFGHLCADVGKLGRSRPISKPGQELLYKKSVQPNRPDNQDICMSKVWINKV